MNRSHKHQLENLKNKNIYTKEDLEIAEELLKQDDPPFHEEVKAVMEKISKILQRENNNNNQ